MEENQTLEGISSFSEVRQAITLEGRREAVMENLWRFE